MNKFTVKSDELGDLHVPYFPSTVPSGTQHMVKYGFRGWLPDKVCIINTPPIKRI